jgi:hypothetical protein
MASFESIACNSARFGVLTAVFFEVSGPLRCDAVSLGEWFPSF